MRQLDESWKQLLHEYDKNLNEAFLAAIFLPMPPQRFIDDHDLCEESHSFNFFQPHWISGDGDWKHNREDASLSDAIWHRIRLQIQKLDTTIKKTKVKAAKEFLQKVDLRSASVHDYLVFRNLYEEEIHEIVYQSTVVDPRDELIFVVFDNIILAKNSSLIGIKFGNGHLPHIDTLLLDRGYKCIMAKYLRVLTIS